MSLPTTKYGKTQEVYKQGTLKRHKLGTRWVFPDGRVFRYMKCGASNITIGRIIGHAAMQATFSKDCKESGATARTTAEWDAGTHTVVLATSASASTSLQIYANRFDEGYVWINDETGEGQMFQIKSHGVSVSTASTGVTFTMDDEDLLTIALTTASEVGVIANLYKDVVIHITDAGGGPGIGVAPRAVTAANYFWGQTWGPCPVMGGKQQALSGAPVIACLTSGDTSAGVAGSVYAPGASSDAARAKIATQSPIGFCLVPATGDAEYTLIYLTIAP